MRKQNVDESIKQTLRIGISALAIILLTASPGLADWADPARVAAVEAGELTEANVLWWGFEADDSTRFLQAAINSGAARVTVPYTGTDWIVAPIMINHEDQTIVFEDRVVIAAKAGSIRGRGDNLFQIRESRNIKLIGHGATLLMPYLDPVQRRTGIGGHLVFINGSENVLIEGLTLRDALRDGIYVGGGLCRDITIREVTADRNSRQGISICNVDGILVEKSVFKNTVGKAPMSGIDLETHGHPTNELLSNVVIRDNLFLNNALVGMHNWPSGHVEDSPPISILWENNYVRGGPVGIQVASVNPTTPKGELIFRNNVIENTRFAGILIRRAAVSELEIRFDGNVLINTASKEPYDEEMIRIFTEKYSGLLDDPGDWWARHGCPSAPIVLTAQGNAPRWQGNISFDQDLIIHNLDEPVVVLSGPWGEHEDIFGPDVEPAEDEFHAWQNISGTIHAINPHGARIDVRTRIENFTLELK